MSQTKARLLFRIWEKTGQGNSNIPFPHTKITLVSTISLADWSETPLCLFFLLVTGTYSILRFKVFYFFYTRIKTQKVS